MGEVKVKVGRPQGTEFSSDDIVIDSTTGNIYFKDREGRLKNIINTFTNVIPEATPNKFLGDLQITGSIGVTQTGSFAYISASGDIHADNFKSTGGDVGGITFADDLNLTGNLTASGDVSASGNLYLDGFISASNNISTDGNISGPPTINASASITITDFTELNTGDKVNLIATDGTNYNFTNGDQSSVNGTWESTNSNNQTATNLMNVINTSSGPSGTRFTATVVDNVVTATQAEPGPEGNTTVTLTDSGTAGMSKTNFTGGKNTLTVDGTLTSGDISSSGEFIGASANITNITASGDISASGKLYSSGLVLSSSTAITPNVNHGTIYFRNKLDNTGEGTQEWMKIASNSISLNVDGNPYISLSPNRMLFNEANDNISFSFNNSVGYSVLQMQLKGTKNLNYHRDHLAIGSGSNVWPTTDGTQNATPDGTLKVWGDLKLADKHGISGSITASGNISSSETIYGNDLQIQRGATFNVDQEAAYDFKVRSENKNHTLYVDSNKDKVGIGFNTPGGSDLSSSLHIAGDLTVSSSNGHITASGDISASGDIQGKDFYIGAGGTGYVKRFGDNDTYLKMMDDRVNLVAGSWSVIRLLKSDGHIQINNSNEDLDLQVMADDGGVILHTDAGTNRLGVNTTTPTKALQVTGDISASGDLYMTIDGGSF